MTGEHRLSRSVGLAAAASCLAAVLLRLTALDMPLDRDLAAYATVGQNLNEGAVPYRDLVDHKQPLVYPVYALLDLVAPHSTTAIRLAAALAAGLAAALVLALGPAIGRRGALLAAALTLLLGASRWAEGTGLNTEHVLVVVEVAAVVVALRWRAAPGVAAPLAAGALCGLAILTKATGAAVVPAVAAALLAGRARPPAATLGLLAAGAALPLGLLAGAYAAAGALGDLWYGNVTYNRLYVGEPFRAVPDNLRAGWPITGLALAAGAAGAWLLWRARPRDPVTAVLLLWVAGTVPAAVFGPYGFGHYYAPVVPAAAALAAHALAGRARLAVAVAAVAVAVASVAAIGDAVQRSRLSGEEVSVRQFSRQTANWVEGERIGRLLRARARPGDRLYAQGSDPNVYWASGVTPASRFFYNLPAGVDPPRWRRETDRDVCGDPPRFYVSLGRMLGFPPDEPACLDRLPYREVARVGLTVAYELEPR